MAKSVVWHVGGDLEAGAYWQPTRIDRVNRVLSTSTKPLHVVTDVGPALLKYMGNRAGPDALISELLAGELANKIGLKTPDFAVLEISEIETEDPFVDVQAEPAFLSCWEPAQSLSPNSKLLANLRHPSEVARLVVFDTWIRNKDRFANDANSGIQNYDNLLFKADGRKTQLLVIDHSHAFAETSLEAEINDAWASEQIVYGLFKEFTSMITRPNLKSAIDDLCALAENDVRDICASPPPQWGFTAPIANRLSSLLIARAKMMRDWMPNAVFAQMEFNLD